MTVKELIDKLKKLDDDKIVLVGGFAVNALEAEAVLDNIQENTVILYIEDVGDEELEETNYKKI